MNKYIYRPILLLLISLNSFSQIDLVFDIDYTIVSEIKFGSQSNMIPINEEGKVVNYILTPWALEVLDSLYEMDEVRISFFSGGSRDRNEKLLKEIILPTSNRSLWEVSHKVLSREDLTPITKSTASSKWSDRYTKDLHKINEDLSWLIVIDDNLNFYQGNQLENVFWLEEGYLPFPSFKASKNIQNQNRANLKNEWFAPSLHQFEAEKSKLLRFHDRFSQILDHAKEKMTSLKESLLSITRDQNGQRITRVSLEEVRSVQNAKKYLINKYEISPHYLGPCQKFLSD